MAIISLMTDFGLKDGNVGVMKGVILGIAPQARIVDVSHHISPQNVAEATLILYRSALYFPQDTIHVVVVDPGVGTTRRSIAARLGPQRFVGPDNGVLTMLLGHAEDQGWPVEIVHTKDAGYWLQNVSHVFHGRDIFAPVAAHLAKGVPLLQVGEAINDPMRIDIPKPVRTTKGLQGEVIHIDHFGNISTSIRYEHLGEPQEVTVRLCGVEIHGLVRTFGERRAGELVALYGSTGSLIVSMVDGSAAQRLGAQVGDGVEVDL